MANSEFRLRGVLLNIEKDGILFFGGNGSGSAGGMICAASIYGRGALIERGKKRAKPREQSVHLVIEVHGS